MKANFDHAFMLTAIYEGGLVDHPKDPGGRTNKGVTQRVYDSFRRVLGVPKQPVDFIANHEVAKIFREQYWNICQCDDLPAGVDYAVFDCAVNSGPRRSAIILQRALGVEEDGIIGVVTLGAAAAAQDKVNLIQTLCRLRLYFVQGLRTYKTFGRGWRRRIMGEQVGYQPDDTGVIDHATRMYLNMDLKPSREAAPGRARDGDESLTTRMGAEVKDVGTWAKTAIGSTLGAGAGLSGTLTGDGPVQYAIAGAIVLAVLCVAAVFAIRSLSSGAGT